MSALLDSNEKYRDVTVYMVDWDSYGRSQLARDLKVARRSTLIMFRDGKELGRVVARTDKASIGGLFDKATS